MNVEAACCNKCGHKIIPTISEDFATIGLSFGYESQLDGQSWTFVLCDNCLLEIIKMFKIVPDGFMIDNYTPILSEEIHQKVFESWKETGEWEDLQFHTYEQLVEFNGWFNPDYLNTYIEKYHHGKPLLSIEELSE